MNLRVVGLALALIAFLVAGCSGDDGEDVQPAGPAVRIELRPRTAILSTDAPTVQLRVVGIDERGVELAVDANLDIDRRGAMIDAAGLVTRTGTAGTALVTATAGALEAMATIVLADPIAGAVLVPDDQIGEIEVVDVDTLAHRASLERPPPAIGTMLIGAGDKPFGGEVVAVDGSAVTVEPRPLDEMFDALVIRRSFDLSNVAPEIRPEVLERYDVAEDEDGALVFKPRDQTPNALRPAQVMGTYALGMFHCEGAGAIPVSLAAADMTLDKNLGYDVDYTLADGLRRLEVHGDATLALDLKPKLTAAFEGKFACNAEMVKIPVPIGGYLSFLFGATVPIGVGFEIGAKVTVADVGAEVKAKAEGGFRLGFSCPIDDDCSAITDLTGDANVEDVRPVIPTLPTTEAPPVEFSAFAYVYADAELGNRLLGFKFGGVKMGAKLGANLATEASQAVAERYESAYKLDVVTELGIGLSTPPKFPLTVNVAKLELKEETNLLQSPTGKLTNVSSDDMMTGTVNLEPDTLRFLVPNVEAVHFYRRVGSTLTNVGSAQATSDTQTRFEATWMLAPGEDADTRFYAFVETKLLPLLGLEVPFATGGVLEAEINHFGTGLGAEDHGEDDRCSMSERLNVTQAPPLSMSAVCSAGAFITWTLDQPTADSLSWYVSAANNNPDGRFTATVLLDLTVDEPGRFEVEVNREWGTLTSELPSDTLGYLEVRHNAQLVESIPFDVARPSEPWTATLDVEPGTHSLNYVLRTDYGVATRHIVADDELVRVVFVPGS